MFAFFRRYQRAIYFIITAVIVLSFSFFGTYSTFTSGKGEDPIVFTTVDGRSLTRSNFTDYVHFLSMESLGGEPGSGLGNPLNDNVIANDIIGSGVGEVLVERFGSQFAQEWVAKFGRERNFQPYHHPQAPFVSAMQVWSYFAPHVKEGLEAYQSTSTDVFLDLYRKKAQLFLAERQFPSVYLRQVLMYQQQQFSWLEPDVSLEMRPLGLFGYQQVTDWFGLPFTEKAVEFIIETADEARKTGMSVTTGEVLASLYQNAQKALQRIPGGENMTPDELIRRTLRECNIDQSRAVSIWSDVLLFRRALIDLPMQIVVNKEPFEQSLSYQYKCADVDCYQLQPALRMASMRDLMKFECWCHAVSEYRIGSSLSLPEKFRSAASVMESWPDLVERHFLLGISSVDIDELMKNIRLRDVWNWQVDNDHWEELVKEIPVLKAACCDTREERLHCLEQLPEQLKRKADDIAKKAIVAQNPEWKEKALSTAKQETLYVCIRPKGGNMPFEGISDRQAFLQALTAAPIGELSAALQVYTQDNCHFYRIQVLDRGVDFDIVPLPDVMADGSLDTVLDRILAGAYEQAKAARPSDYRKENGEWKPFSEVKDKVGDFYFASFIRRLDQAIAEYKVKLPGYCQWDDVKSARVAVRFLPHLVMLAEKIQNGDLSVVTTPYLPKEVHTSQPAMEDRPLSDLFLLVVTKQKTLRKDANPILADALDAKEGAWLPPRYSQDFGPFVGRVVSIGEDDYSESLRAAVFSVQESLGREAVMERAQTIGALLEKH